MSKSGEVYVLGAGGHAKVVVSTLQYLGHRVKALFDDDHRRWGHTVLGVPVRGAVDEIQQLTPARAVIGIGDNATRRALAERLMIDWMTLVHPKAEVHPSVRLGPGTVVFAGAIVQPDSVIGAHNIINTAATVDHDCVIGDYVHVAPGTHLSGGVRLGEGVFLGIGSAVIPGVKIGSWTTVGAGGVIIKDLPAGVLAVGVPANPMRITAHK